MKKRFIYIMFVLASFGTKAQSLESYLQEAEQNSPMIQALELRYNIAKEKVNEVNTLPNTTVAAGYFVSEPETRTGAQRARFSVSQMLPWFGTITARENYASSMAETEYAEIVIAKRKLALSLAQSYYNLYGIQAKQKVLQENIELLKTYETLALTSVEVGKASAVDILKLQIRQNELQQQNEVLEQSYLSEQAVFNNLLNREERIAVEVVEEMEIPEDDTILNKDDLSLNPELLKYDQLYESVTQSEVLNQKENAPSFGIGLDYIPVSEREDMAMSDNGKDIVMPMVTFSIPIFNNKFKSVTRQNELRQKEIEFQKEERLNVLENAYASAISQRNQARIAYRTQAKNLEQAKDAEEILIKSYETGTINFNDVLDVQELQLKFQTSQIQSVQLYYIQSAIINYLINK
ncbi:TolC family protein [Muricauda ruestringensis]|uniref:TolC family protein n=1 Tax=Flagellimonas aurea TaxID=2915619 RepID=A0ABS3G7U5_9FLAO|nr:TolC family protein [Allomuricauda aurea]MAO17855.1 transporter [Allomuricauda sp.]MBO0355348.1 TolC family protein [Allomuricauda aurea]|tara:strand:+ start:248 stop:1468 length:1221 start_codon:yes stop_codon:yes gene_type:complete